MLQVLKRPRYIRHTSDHPYLATVMRHAFYARKHLPVENASLDELTIEAEAGERARVEDSVEARLLIRDRRPWTGRIGR